ncbi:hypothetical protein ABTY61_32400 [Kitasatospora sp. NPDC096128]|uniref:hypothetical protein n=1 Tax=Kitasatospora sp. NPDC096128 TaxID=3155547 RepID=UPI003323AC7D
MTSTLLGGGVPADAAARLYRLLPRTHHLRRWPAPDPDGQGAARWLADYTRELLSVFGRPVVEYQGRTLRTQSLLLNTALASSSDALRLAARLHGQCEIHCWVAGANRSWLARIVEEGLTTGAYGSEVGWEGVVTLLRQRDDHPVVVSYGEEFPSVWDGGDPDLDGEDALEAWEALPLGDRWERGMRVLRARAADELEISPARWSSYRFGHEAGVADLLTYSWEQHLQRAVGLTQTP